MKILGVILFVLFFAVWIFKGWSFSVKLPPIKDGAIYAWNALRGNYSEAPKETIEIMIDWGRKP